MTEHNNTRLRLDVRFRELTVLRTEEVTPHMRRIVLGGDDLAGFDSPGADDHIKLFFPNAAGEMVLPVLTAEGRSYPAGKEPSPSRDYTPRWWDHETGELAIDFVLHDQGIAGPWAERAQPGDTLVIGGPRGSFVVADTYDAYVLIGDETALPAIARWLDVLPDGAEVQAFIEVRDEDERQDLPQYENVRIHWLERNGFPAASSTLLEDMLTDFEAPDGDVFYWIATESRRARMMRKFIEGHLGVPRDWIRSTGYWKAHPDETDGD
ncbi:siderophore-interacting protein [Stenotrophomonas sp.]|uniref:siderophore-interacting protein n=1 Tax=Stenotrophomonas sp. TaxID=69392 RepID=UPI001D0FAB99|nr:siderophore-interacting protein [Stenotrophomonas sp.]MCR1572350.1 siderophore-interacting protein [Stenotrophomonas sp.]UXB40576.1 siderophore-interacting protein [Stenotrophomonas maltophilia]